MRKCKNDKVNRSTSSLDGISWKLGWQKLIYFSVKIWRKCYSFLFMRAHLSSSWHMNASVSEGMYENLVKCPQMVPKVDVPKLLFQRRSDLYFHLFLFLWFKLNSFKEVIYREECEEENGCSMAVFGVTLLCLCLFPLKGFVGPRLRPRYWLGSAKFQKKGQIPSARVELKNKHTHPHEECQWHGKRGG